MVTIRENPFLKPLFWACSSHIRQSAEVKWTDFLIGSDVTIGNSFEGRLGAQFRFWV